eukprot:RCo055083
MGAIYPDHYVECAGVPVPTINWTTVSLLTVVIWVIRSALWSSFQQRARAILPDPRQEEAVEKVSKYIWHGLYYLLTSVWGAVIMYYSPAGFSLSLLVRDGCQDPNLGPVHFFFFAQLAWYIHGLAEILLYDANRKDVLLMIAHHFLSMILIYGALVAHLHRIGLMVMLEQDFSDFALYIGRMIQKYAVDPVTGKPRHLFAQRFLTFGIVVMSVVWLICRKLVLFGIVAYCSHYIYHTGFFNLPRWRQTLSVSLVALLLMQVAWGMALFRMCYEQIRVGAFKEYYFDVEKKKKTP